MAQMKAAKRSEMGSRKAVKLREKGMIPAIVYGHGQECVPVTVSEHEIDLAIHHGERLLEVDLEGKTENVLIKDVQYDTFGQDILHVDLFRVDLNERVEVTVPVILRGTPAGVAEGGVLQQVLSDLEIECVVTAIPDDVTISVTEMKIDDVLHVRDLPLPEGASLISDPEEVVATVSVLAEEEEVAEEAEAVEGAEPEVIGEKPEEEEEGEEKPEEE